MPLFNINALEECFLVKNDKNLNSRTFEACNAYKIIKLNMLTKFFVNLKSGKYKYKLNHFEYIIHTIF